ncbi:MAG: hypothetical protein LKK00_00070 [Intestinimonas sp.]|jgi:hypothetical protein|nr:hypothetical protein [Intestinimonas sp.]
MNYKHCCVINAAGYYQTLVLVLLPDGEDQQIQGYTLKSGESFIDTAPPSGFVKPRWDGSAWAEGATAEEIAAWGAKNPGPDIASIRAKRIASSKTQLAAYLLAHPMTWTDGSQYSVTAEKQSLLTSQLALYSVAAAAGESYQLRWNTTGGECTEWTYENLSALALDIGAYVQPFVSYQQAREVEITNCTTAAEVEAITIDYASVSA